MSGPAMDHELLNRAVRAIDPLDEAASAAARSRLDQLTKPPGSLGRLEDLVVQLAGITGKPADPVRPARIVVVAADHGIARSGVSAWPQEVTGQMVRTYLDGKAAINALAGWAGTTVIVVDAGLAMEPPLMTDGTAAERSVRLISAPIRRGGTGDLSAGPAMTRVEALAAVELGLGIAADLAGDGVRAIGVGEMGIGNTTAASAIATVMSGADSETVTGSGTGVDAAGRRRKVAAIERAIDRGAAVPDDPLGVLAEVGGFEIGALTGVILGAAAARIPVVLDGFITAAAAVLAAAMAPELPPRLIAAHRSPEPGHVVLLDHLALVPLLDLGMRLGEGTGAALGLGLLDAACRIRDEMATFGEAGVAGRL
jgi:nicotinate-nucleotide--dimethylbenzimidazole phosphoribosyltransferase